MILFLMIIFDIILCFFSKIYIKEKTHKIFMYLAILGFTIYSGIGIQIYSNKIDGPTVYFFQYILFLVVFFFFVFFSSKLKKNKLLNGLDNLLESKIFMIFVVIYFFTFIYELSFSGMKLNISNLINIFSEYKATAFAVRVLRRENVIYSLIVNQIRSICTPFFYIFLYKHKDNILIFISLYLFPILCDTLANSYLSRNKIAVHLVFIFIYLILERKISKKLAKIITVFLIPVMLFYFSLMAQKRLGVNNSDGFFQSILNLVSSEIEYPSLYNYCLAANKEVSLVNFIGYILLVCIPSQLYKYIGLTVPNLAYTFTKYVIGLSYGQTNNYYILLPSVLGESIMLFGKYFAWMYAIIYGVISTWFLRILRSRECLKYYLVYFLLDFFRQFRGGSQYVISTWETQLIPLIIIVFIYNSILKKGVNNG